MQFVTCVDAAIQVSPYEIRNHIELFQLYEIVKRKN